MGRSVSKPVVSASADYYHRGSNRHYRLLRRGPDSFLRRHQVDGSRGEVNVLERRIDFAIGSGNHARTYVHRTAQSRLIELPLSWYIEGGGTWAMSPGYDRADHLDFRREVTEKCLFCHSAYPSTSNGGAPAAIDCQRCHGPGESHLSKPGRGSIVNPARLPRDRQLEVCLQCHLETASSGFLDSILHVGRTAFSYRPGEQLADYKVYFDRVDPSDKLEVNHAGYRLMKSRCSTASEGRLLCTTCHDPHGARRIEVATACRTCHSTEHARERTDCAACHMPKRRTQDAIHVVMTDHLIARRPPVGDLTAAITERHDPYLGAIVPFYPSNAVVTERAEYWIDQAETHRRSGNLAKAIDAYREALKREPESVAVRAALGDALIRQKNVAAAVAMLEPALKKDPQHTGALVALAVARGIEGRVNDSLRLLERAIKINPDLPLAWLNLGVAREQKCDLRAAEAAYREAIRLQPDFLEARHHLNTLLSTAARCR
jgi:Tfp pilus assembly protein PilF